MFKRIVLLLVAFLATPAHAQSSFIAMAKAYNSTLVFNVGDSVNSALRVNVVAGGGAGGTSSSFGAAMPATGTAAGFSDGTNMQAARVVDADTGAGTDYVLKSNLVRRASGGPTEMIGQTTMALSLPVAIASDQGAVPIKTSQIASANNDGAAVGLTTTSATILASFATRAFAAVCSLPSNTDVVYIKLAATATTSDFVLSPGQCFNTPSGVSYSGIIDGRSASGTQTVTFLEW